MQTKAHSLIASVALLFLLQAPATAAPPELLSYQGVLLDANGVAVADGLYNLRFRLFPQATMGTDVFEQALNVEVRKGLYNVVLSNAGSNDLGDVTSQNPQLFMEVTILADGVTILSDIVFSPRQQLTSVPYALSAPVPPPPPPPPPAPACYTNWGQSSCATPFEQVVTGHLGGLMLYSNTNLGAAVPRAHPECVSDSALAVPNEYWPTYYNRLFRGTLNGQGVDEVATDCSVCCTGGCFVAVGATSCPVGYQAVVSGRLGGVEAVVVTPVGKPVCVSDTAGVVTAYPALANMSRLHRYGPAVSGAANGMQGVENRCLQCCKVN